MDPEASQPTPKSLVLDLLSTVRRGAMPVRALVEAAALFGLAEGGVRVALTRLVADGLVERDERGLYRLGGAAQAVTERVAWWRRLGERTRAWSGGWVGALAPRGEAAARAERRRHERALRLVGLRELTPGLAVRPDNLAGGIERTREELARLGLAPGALVFALRDLDPVSDARARALWDAEGLVAEYRRLRRAVDASARRFPELAESEAMTESFSLGGTVLRHLALDPLLPEPIVPAAEREALVAAMHRYDALGRASWRAFLVHHGVRPIGAPADTRELRAGARRRAGAPA